MVRKDGQGRYYVDNASVADTRVARLFTILTCANATTHNVLTAFFRLIDRETPVE